MVGVTDRIEWAAAKLVAREAQQILRDHPELTWEAALARARRYLGL